MYKIKEFLRKNIFTKKIYYHLYKIKNNKKIKELQKYTLEATKQIYDAFEILDYEYSYDFGNLLGIVRDHCFMEYDNDIDLMLFEEDYDRIVKLPELVKEYGFNLDHYYIVDNKIVEYTFIFRNTGLTIDVFIKEKENNEICHSYWLYQDNDKKYSSKDEMSVAIAKSSIPSGYTYVNYWNVELRIPINSEDILYWHYGKNWRIKDPNYSEKKSPGFSYTNKIGKRIKKELTK